MNTNTLITSSQAAAIAGITPSTFRTLAAKPTTKTPIPAPAISHPGGKLWQRADIEQWAQQRDNKRGRAKRGA